MSKETKQESKTKRLSEESDATVSKRPKTDETVDLARLMELAPGTRLKVHWEITKDTGESLTHWWGATLLAHDGRSHDGVAIRVLEYDTFDDGGFAEKSQEDVIFIGKDVLVNFPSEEQLPYKVMAEDDSEVFFSSVEEVEGIIDNILAAALEKASAGFQALPRSRQAAIADTISRKKEKLVSLIREHLADHTVLTEQNVRDLMAQTVADK